MIVSSCLVFIYLGFYCYQFYRKKESVDPRKSKMISMVLGMSNSVLVGLIIGILLQEKFALSTMLSIIVSLMVGFVIGKPFGGTAVAEAFCSGFMGGMMGAMLGVMLPAQDVNTMFLFMDFIYIISMSLMIILLKNKKPLSSFVLSAIIPIIILTSISLLGTENTVHQNNMQNHHEMNMHE